MTPVIERLSREIENLSALLSGPAAYADQAAHISRARALRSRAFGAAAELFGDPAWDILLDLYTAHVRGQLISISSATIAAAVPPTTALRYIEALQRHGLVERRPDPDDRRRWYLIPTEAAISAMEAWFAEI